MREATAAATRVQCPGQVLKEHQWEALAPLRNGDKRIFLFPSQGIASEPLNAVLMTYPDSGHGSLFQFHAAFTGQAAAFLASDFPFAPY